jgi:Tol biopolymer transport system component
MRGLVAGIIGMCLLVIGLSIWWGRHLRFPAKFVSQRIEVVSNTPVALMRPQVLAFENEHSWDIYLHDVTGGLRQLTASLATDRFPVLAPNEQQVAFVSWRDGNSEIYIHDIQSGSLQNVSRHPGRDVLPVWSPDSSMLVFVSDRDGNHDLWVADVLRGLVHKLARYPAHDTGPQWQVDGLSSDLVDVVRWHIDS